MSLSGINTSFFAFRFLKSELINRGFEDLYMPSTGALMLLTALHTCDQVGALGSSRCMQMRLSMARYSLPESHLLMKTLGMYPMAKDSSATSTPTRPACVATMQGPLQDGSWASLASTPTATCPQRFRPALCGI